MNSMNIYNIKNVVIWGKYEDFEYELKELSLDDHFNVFIESDLNALEHIFNAQLVHLVIIDSKFGLDHIKSQIQYLYRNGFHTIPMLLAMDNELLIERCEYFTHGITAFYDRTQKEYFMSTILKMDRELTFKEGLKEMSIAVLDDDKLQLIILKDMLFKNSILNVDFYSNPKSLLKTTKTYDIYLIDLILPEIDGEMVMLEIRKRNENAVIIGISSIEKQSTIAKVLSIGANDYITKPVNEQVFMAKLYTNARILMLLKENEIKNKILENLAIKDGLTDLYNHKHIHEMLETNIRLAKRYGRELSLMMIDIDNFKTVNDCYGHQFGDTVLTHVANEIKASVRESDIIGRYGGEEFIIILPETSAREAYILGDRIRNNISSIVFKHDIHITVSGGISQLVVDSQQLIYDADQLLYHSKNNGKNQISYKNKLNRVEKESFLTS